MLAGRGSGGHLRDVGRPRRKLRARAELGDLRLHDVRHSFASLALALGESLPTISESPSHTEVQTTAQYAHLAKDFVREAAVRVAGSMLAEMLPAHAQMGEDARRRGEPGGRDCG